MHIPMSMSMYLPMHVPTCFQAARCIASLLGDDAVRHALTFPSYPPTTVLPPGAAARGEAGVQLEAVAVVEAVARRLGECSGADADVRCALVRSRSSAAL